MRQSRSFISSSSFSLQCLPIISCRFNRSAARSSALNGMRISSTALARQVKRGGGGRKPLLELFISLAVGWRLDVPFFFSQPLEVGEVPDSSQGTSERWAIKIKWNTCRNSRAALLLLAWVNPGAPAHGQIFSNAHGLSIAPDGPSNRSNERKLETKEPIQRYSRSGTSDMTGGPTSLCRKGAAPQRGLCTGKWSPWRCRPTRPSRS